ncbi:hypothetical protein, partial [Xylanibacillus composti]|uniref:hypothetical protein n=1 Tax=Xylanibacillus composti TaxID=1572762 RepID=UPI0028F73FDA
LERAYAHFNACVVSIPTNRLFRFNHNGFNEDVYSLFSFQSAVPANWPEDQYTTFSLLLQAVLSSRLPSHSLKRG